MTCKDCIHKDVCSKEHIATDIDNRYFDYSELNNIEEECEDFKSEDGGINMSEDLKYIIHLEQMPSGKVSVRAEKGGEVIEHEAKSMMLAVFMAEEIADYFEGSGRNE